jgi:hypothetical protein
MSNIEKLVLRLSWVVSGVEHGPQNLTRPILATKGFVSKVPAHVGGSWNRNIGQTNSRKLVAVGIDGGHKCAIAAC